MDIYTKLRSLEKGASQNVNDLLDLTILMNSDEVRNSIDDLIEKENFTEQDKSNCLDIINAAQMIFNYSGDSTGMSDSEYDILYEKLKSYDESLGITVPIVSNSDIVYHKYKSLRGTLDKIYALTDDEKVKNKSQKTLDEWIASAERKIFEKTGERIKLNQEEIYCFPKFDGVSGILECKTNGELDRALSRGFTETNEAQDITHVLKGRFKGPYDNSDKPYAVKTEIMMTNQDFERYNKTYGTDYKNSRSIVSSILNSDELDNRADYLKIVPLRLSFLDKNGDESLQSLAPGAFDYPYLRTFMNQRDKMKEFALSHFLVNGLRCDGMVIYIINPKIQSILGRENNKQKFEVAYKFTEEIGYSEITNINFTTGLFGRINPVASIKPIKLKGNTIENISLGSIGRMNDLKLAIGDKVKISYDIIPYLLFDKDDKKCKRSGNTPIEPPIICPDCLEELKYSDSEDLLYCDNPDCPCRKKGKILNYLNKMHIDGISYATVDLLYDEGYLKSIKDIYKLEKNKNQITKISGLGEKSVQLMIDEINSNREVASSTMLGSIGIEGNSTKTFSKLLSVITFDELMEYSLDIEHTSKAISLLSSIPGIKDKTAYKIIDGIRENEKLIYYLEKELILLDEPKKKTYKFSVVFTKVRDEELEKWTIANDGLVADSLTKDTDILVVPMLGTSSSKVDKAKKYNIDIVPIDDYQAYVTKTYLR